MKFNNSKFIFVIFLCIYTLSRLQFLNLNIAEFGDSYKILSSASSISNVTDLYADKRLPLLPILLSLFNGYFDQIMISRLAMLAFSLISLIYFSKLLGKFFKSPLLNFIGVCMLALHPVYSYWSMRIMTDGLYIMLLIMFLYFIKSDSKFTFKSLLILMLLTFTRTETILFSTPLLLLLFVYHRFEALKMSIALLPQVAFYCYGILNNLPTPFSTYANENTSYNIIPYELGVNLIYLVFFLSPIMVACLIHFIRKQEISAIKNHLKSVSILNLLLLCLLLPIPVLLVWKAAIPRTLLYLLPIGVLFLLNIVSEITTTFIKIFKSNLHLTISALSIPLLYYFRPHFLIGGLSTYIIGFSIYLISIFSYRAYNIKNYGLALYSLLIFFSLISFTTILQDRYLMSSLVQAAKFGKDLNSKVIYSDESGISRYYLGENGIYFEGNFHAALFVDEMKKKGIQYALVSTEIYEENGTLLFLKDTDVLGDEKAMRVATFKRIQSADYLDHVLYTLIGKEVPKGKEFVSIIYKLY